MKRLKSVDTFRGIIMAQMIWAHLIGWWILKSQGWIAGLTIPFIDRGMAGGGFLFISGLSTSLFVKSRFESGKEYRRVKREYFIRSSFILGLSSLYNLAVTYGTDITWIWSWFMLQTIAVSLFMSWPLLKTSKTLRIIIALGIWVINIYILDFLSPYEGQLSIYGVVFHILFNPLELDPILAVFCFFLVGTVVGDVIFDAYQIEDQERKQKYIKNNIVIPLYIIGVILLIAGIILGFPGIVYDSSIYAPTQIGWVAAVFGIDIIVFVLLFTFQDYKDSNREKNFRFFSYFSYYSLTIYLSHNALYFLFFRSLPWYIDYIFVSSVIVVYFVVLKKLYESKWRRTLSIKVAMGRMAVEAEVRLEKRKNKKE